MTLELKLEVADEYFGPFAETYEFKTIAEVDEFLDNVELDTGSVACIISYEVSK